LEEFSGFSGAGVISGTAVMARRADRRDRGKSGIHGKLADNGAGATRGERWWLEQWREVPAGFAARAPREGEREKMTGVSRG
jgi:hypothetical protein